MRRKSRSVRAFVALVAVVAAPVAMVVLTTSAAGAVTDDASFRAAWLNDATVTLTQSFSLDCSLPTPPRNTASGVTVEGNGFTITQCTSADRGFMVQSGSGAVTIQHLNLVGSSEGVSTIGALNFNASTVTGYGHDASAGVVLSSPGTITLDGSTIVDSHAGGQLIAVNGTSGVVLRTSTIRETVADLTFGITSKGDVSLTDSVIADTEANDGDAYGISTQDGDVTLTRSSIDTTTGFAGAVGINAPDGATKLLDGSSITNTVGDTFAAAVSSNHGMITLDGSRIQHTASGVGGAAGLTSQAQISLTGSAIVDTSSRESDVAAINSQSDVDLTDSQITDTVSGEFAASGIDTLGGVTLVRSTIARTAAPVFAAAISAGEDVELTNSTIADNDGFAIDADDDVTLVYSDIVGNGFDVEAGIDAPALLGQVDASGDLFTFGTVFASPQGILVNCSVGGTTTSDGYNFADDSTCDLTETGDQQGDGLDPQLGALAANGGPTPTLLPATTSPLVDAIPAAACQMAPLATGITVDQRSLPRPAFAGCDIGSVELQPAPPVAEPDAVVITPKFTG